mmetsp:Transcript_70987/g.219442  ORF Transcript_70987/g.219442 Transcript_70987/m.219442 type:complete len:322 (-) Transcript_70987:175-1140(-)
MALPPFYGVMCFMAVRVVSQFFLDFLDPWTGDGAHPFDGDETKVDFANDMVEFFFAIASVFEVEALRRFVELMLHSEEMGDARIRDRAGEVVEKREGKIWRQRRFVNQVLRLHANVFRVLLVGSLVVMCANVWAQHFDLQSSLEWLLPVTFANGIVNIISDCSPTVSAAVGIATPIVSSLAVYYIFTGETLYTEELAEVGFLRHSAGGAGRLAASFEEVRTSKFWGVKIIVSLEFVLDVFFSLYSLFFTLNKPMQNFLYSVIMSVVCFFVSLIHCWAYVPGDWANGAAETATRSRSWQARPGWSGQARPGPGVQVMALSTP